MVGRRDFLNQEAPANYVAGLGRGATGFVTRSDLGPARDGPSEEQIQEAIAKRAAAVGAAPPIGFGRKRRGEFGKDGRDEATTETNDDDGGAGGGDDDDGRFQDPDNEVGLFAGGVYDREDDEADRVYQDIDERMGKRRRLIREAREQKEREEYERNNPKISAQFADLKRSLATVTDEEWANLPEVGDLTGRNRRSRQNLRQRFYAVPDSVIAGARDSLEIDTSISANEGRSGDAADGTMTNFVDIGAAREKALQMKLDQASGTATVLPGTRSTVPSAATSSGEATAAGGSFGVGGMSTSIDPKGYLTSLTQSEFKAGEVNIGEVKRVRGLLESVIKTNPKHGPGWRAAARLEQIAGRLVEARRIIARGCQHCPHDVDVWLENIRMNESRNAKIIAAEALRLNDQSVELWIAAMELETDVRSKKKVLRHALDHLPQSVRLWKEAVNLEEDATSARLLLASATETIPLSVELWLALARLETPEKAQAVLNKARKAIPTSHEIWVAACRLQEQLGQDGMVPKLMERAVRSLGRESAMPGRAEWLAEAERCESEGAVLTCRAIVSFTIGWELEEDDGRKEVWLTDARSCYLRGHFETSRAVYRHTLKVFPTDREVWVAAAELEKNFLESGGGEDKRKDGEDGIAGAGQDDDAMAVDGKVVTGTGDRQNSPSDWDAIGPSAATLFATLERAVEACPHADDLWLRLAKERRLAGQLDAARRTLGRAFNQNPNSENIWLAAVKLEADTGQRSAARELLATARREADTDRIWIKSIAFERQECTASGDKEARKLVEQALERYPRTPKLWMLKGQILDRAGDTTGARQAYGAGIARCPNSVPLWLLASELEERAGFIPKARSLLDRGRTALPNSPDLWAASVALEFRASSAAAAAGQSSSGSGPSTAANAALSAAKRLLAQAQQQLPTSGLLHNLNIWYVQARTTRKNYALSAIRQTDPPDPALFISMARILWAERKMEKANWWFDKALGLDPLQGDSWAWYYRFLKERARAEAEAAKSASAPAASSKVRFADEVVGSTLPPSVTDPGGSSSGSAAAAGTGAATAASPPALSGEASSTSVAVPPPDGQPDSELSTNPSSQSFPEMERLTNLVRLCIQAEPRYGRIWPRVAKDPKNSGLSIDKILKLVAAEVVRDGW